MPATPTESTFELAAIHRLQALGYRYLHGSDIDRSLHAVVLGGPPRDDLDSHRSQNLVRYHSFQQMLDEAIARYNNRAIQAADVIAVMIEIRQQQMVHQVVEAVRANLKVDWTQARLRDVHASVQSAVNRVVRKNHVRGEVFTFLQKRLMRQAEATYEQWPLAA